MFLNLTTTTKGWQSRRLVHLHSQQAQVGVRRRHRGASRQVRAHGEQGGVAGCDQQAQRGRERERHHRAVAVRLRHQHRLGQRDQRRRSGQGRRRPQSGQRRQARPSAARRDVRAVHAQGLPRAHQVDQGGHRGQERRRARPLEARRLADGRAAQDVQRHRDHLPLEDGQLAGRVRHRRHPCGRRRTTAHGPRRLDQARRCRHRLRHQRHHR